VLELHMATLLRHQNPIIGFQGFDDQAAIHGVYLYTFEFLVNISVPHANETKKAQATTSNN
jgi:hypothetical protein